MDEGDLGNKNAAFFLDQSLARARSREDGAASSEICVDCGEPIPEARRLAVKGCHRCVECKSAHEVHHGS